MNNNYKTHLLAFNLMILFNINVFSDDAAIRVEGGNLSIMQEHSFIKMVGENVRISLGEVDYNVDATFLFYNEGISTTVLVGFPQFAEGAVRQIGEFTTFDTFINDKEVQTIISSNVIVDSGPQILKKWKLKYVDFPSKEFTSTRVLYTAPYGRSANTSKYLTYTIGNGLSWSGKIGVSTFTLTFHDNTQLDLEEMPFFLGEGIQLRKFERKRNEMCWVVDEFEPNEYASFVIWLNQPFQEWENLLNLDKFQYSNETVNEFVLRLLSPGQLRILRNEIYARNGKIYKSSDLAEYFKKKKWYHPDKSFDESSLSDIEKQNIGIIAEYENSLKN